MPETSECLGNKEAFMTYSLIETDKHLVGRKNTVQLVA